MNGFAREGNNNSVQLQSGTLITCDIAAKQILVFLDSLRDGPDKFVIQDVDDTHLFVKTHMVDEIRMRLTEQLETFHYKPDEAD